MKKNVALIILLSFLISCKSEKKKEFEKEVKIETFITDDFEIIKPIEDSKAVLILFGGFGEKAVDIKREFQVLDIAKKNQISLVLMNYSNKLWLEENDKKNLATLLQNTLEKHNLSHKDIYIGGFSSGGIVSLLISNYITGMKEFYIDPKGVFIADSPIDLLALYKASEINIKKNFSDVAVQESTWILQLFNKELGNPKDGISKYEKHAVFTSESNYTKNLSNLKNTKIRLYTEPDLNWWKVNRKTDFEQTNAYYIQKLSKSLHKLDFKDVTYITTKNKGYRANGDRHPHSWSIIDKENLFNWILNNN
ncbi:hypothetical protein QWY81_11795 [Polaribacter undariae]|uniref:Alpha/beta hydrolase n=2 Tax=Polaribacter sejongensis TaxID=985043 RepID=A0AAJ1QXW5_9FLAO|nr:hypothetical protein [Polaribacter undariae]MDN3620137.1 hypothetical protein [Polaribacter undariae]UWD32540.1 hypothetical protein NQP51_02445 [Polaribacter undariae]